MIKRVFRSGLIGARIIKTGIAVFLTSMICLTLNLPAIFAVVTAIVTIEPTAYDSLRKGLIRLPASGLGAMFAVFNVYIWGEAAISYTLAAVLTIFSCQILRLQAGTLVATLTAVAMIPDIQEPYLLSFLTRLSTTTIGLVVSATVNFFILPPKYTPMISKHLQTSFRQASHVIHETTDRIFTRKNSDYPTLSETYIEFRRSIEKINDLALFQEKEWHYHTVKRSELKRFNHLKEIITSMQKVVLHLGNLQYLHKPIYLNDEEQKTVEEVVLLLSTMMEDPNKSFSDYDYYVMNDLNHHLQFAYQQKINPQDHHYFSDRTVLFYELLSLHDALEELHEAITHMETIDKDFNVKNVKNK
ncbi:FUSC family protein [Texcoconibacillus texcoconensis]|nr:aromatic acid exporter family protein [Texcoconibacillus texcoconensis]